MSKQDQQIELLREVFKAELNAAISPLSNDITSMKKSLFGNGQPGLIQRVQNLENWRWYTVGAIALLSATLVFFKDPILQFIFK